MTPKSERISTKEQNSVSPPSEKNINADLQCDYLVVGAGTTGMSFIDTLLTKNSTATVVLVDRNSRPGGHWVQAYPFVRLHQPSCFYGVNSLPLGKVRNRRGREIFDRDDRATATEVVEYYEKVIGQFESCGRVKCFFDAEYKYAESETKPKSDNPASSHTIISGCGKVSKVRCTKLVTVSSNVVVPSMRKPLIPVHESVEIIPVNGVPDAVTSEKYTNFVVLGAGKTGSDAVIELLLKGIDPSQIKWIISQDVWYFIRDVLYKDNGSFDESVRGIRPFLEEFTVKDAFLAVEKSGQAARLDPNGPFPEVCRGPQVSLKEMDMLRSIKDTVRLGRVVSIGASDMTLERGSLSFSNSQTLFVDCMVEGFYGYGTVKEGFKIFEPGRVNLGPLFMVFNPSFSSAITAYVESTFVSDEIKNSIFFFLAGKYSLGTPTTMLGGVYAQMKTMNALMKLHPPAAKFLLYSRTNPDSVNNRAGGSLLKLLWASFGPLQLAKKGGIFVKKVEDGGFSDIDHCFGVGRPLPTKPSSKFLLRKTNAKKLGHRYP